MSIDRGKLHHELHDYLFAVIIMTRTCVTLTFISLRNRHSQNTCCNVGCLQFVDDSEHMTSIITVDHHCCGWG